MNQNSLRRNGRRRSPSARHTCPTSGCNRQSWFPHARLTKGLPRMTATRAPKPAVSAEPEYDARSSGCRDYFYLFAVVVAFDTRDTF